MKLRRIKRALTANPPRRTPSQVAMDVLCELGTYWSPMDYRARGQWLRSLGMDLIAAGDHWDEVNR